MYLQPSDAIVRPGNAKFKRRDVDETLHKCQPPSGKFESTLYYMRDRGMAELWGWNVGEGAERSNVQASGHWHTVSLASELIAFQAPYGGFLNLLTNVQLQCTSVRIFSDPLQAERLYRPSVIPKVLFR